MSTAQKVKKILFNETSVFIYLWIALFLFMTLFGRNRNHFYISVAQVAFVGNYIIITSVNNFALIPRYLIKGKYLSYFILLPALILVSGFNEEYLIEPLVIDTKRQDASIIGFGFAVFKTLFIVGLFSSYKLIWDYQRKQRRLEQLEKEKVESELKFLKSQISPHVLFNNLNNIYSYALEGSDKTSDMIMKLSEIMRYMIYEAREQKVSLKKEVNYLRDFVELQQIRLEDRGEVRFEVEGELDGKQIAPLLLIAFVENSFKHGMVVPDKKVYIFVRVKLDGNRLNFYAENSRDASSSVTLNDVETENGIGLANVRKRLELLYPDRHELKFVEEDSRFYVNLNIDL